MALIFDEDLLAPFPIVLPFDDALDNPERRDFPEGKAGEVAFDAASAVWAAAWKEFLRSRDWQKLPCRGDRKPTVFMAQPLTPLQSEAFDKALTVVRDAHGNMSARPGAQILTAIAYGVVDVLNLMRRKDGKLEPFAVKREFGEFGERLSEDTMRIFADPEVRQFVYVEIKSRAKLTQEQSFRDPL